MDFLTDNWAVVLPLIGAGLALFFPQLKPIIDNIVKPAPSPGPAPDPAPQPVGPDNPIVIPNRPGLTIALQLAMALLHQMRKDGNKEGEAAAMQAAKACIDCGHEGHK